MVRRQGQAGFTILETIFVVALIGIISAIAVPMFGNALSDFKLSGDARSVSNAVALAKMRAASRFTRVRLYVDLAGESHHLEYWDKDASSWTADGGTTSLSSGIAFSYGIVGAPPPSTQATIGQAPACKDDDGDDIANTACIMFNSRGVPIDATLAPTGGGALYLTDGQAVYGITIAATGMLRTWRTFPLATPSWTLS